MYPLHWLSACALVGSLAGWPAWAQPAATPEQPQVAASDSSGASAEAVAEAVAKSAAAGESAAGSISLRAALEVAWQRAVAARESEGQRRRAEAERDATSSLWAAPPSLHLSHRNDRLHSPAGRRETEFGVSVPLWLPGQKAARASTADAAAAQAQVLQQVARLRLAGELRELAWQGAAAQADAAQTAAFTQSLLQLADDVDRRVRAGELAPADALAAQAELLASTAQQVDANQRLQAARRRWMVLSGQTGLPDLTAAAGAETASAPAALHPELHPELQLARQSTELARKRVELMRHSGRDAPELTLGLRQDVPGRPEATQTSLVVGLRLPLGTADRNRPLEVAALGQLEVALTHEERLRESVISDIAVARDAERAAQAQLDAETARARLLRERANLIDKSFRAGEAQLPDLLRALAAAAQADSAVARLTTALGLARARVQQTLGNLP